MGQPLFSIIVPVYNVENYLEECIKSILAQTIVDYEIILVDDGSTDNSCELCDLFQKNYKKIKTYHVPNGGLSSARNYGVEKSTGKYLVFIDSDDFIRSTALQDFKACIERYPNIDIITSNGKYLVYKNKMYAAKYPDQFSTLDGKDGISWVISFLKSGIDNWNAPGQCFRKDFWCNNKFIFKKGRLSEDVELIYKVMLKARKMAIIDTFYYYRQSRPDSIIGMGSSKLLKDTVLNLKEWDNFLQNNKVLTNEQKKLFYERFSRQYCTSVLSVFYSFPVSVREKLKSDVMMIKFFLNRGNGKVVKLCRILDAVIGFDGMCHFLYILRKLSKKLVKVKWIVAGEKLYVN